MNQIDDSEELKRSSRRERAPDYFLGLVQVVLNLILNSKEAMSVPTCHTRDLLIQSEQTGSEAIIIVADTGREGVCYGLSSSISFRSDYWPVSRNAADD